MQTIGEALGFVAGGLSDKNYAQSLDFYHFWLGTGRTHIQVPSDQIFDAIWNNRAAGSSIDSSSCQLIHSAAHLILRFASDVQSDHILSPYSAGLESRLCAGSLREFSNNNLMIARYGQDAVGGFYADVNLVAHWTNLGYVEEATIRGHILQSLISHPKLYDHQADALIILLKLAGATFEAYADPSVVDRCFELLRGHSYTPPYDADLEWKRKWNDKYLRDRGKLIQELATLRESGWEGIPPPPVFTSRQKKPVVANQKDPAATPVATFLGLPNRDLEPQNLQAPPPEFVTAPETDAVTASHITQSPAISISTLSDFTTADPSDDESPTGPTFADTSDDEPLIDPTAVVPHETFYLDDGNVEVLCGNTLFRVTASILSFHSPTLRRMFARDNLVAAESPNGCPRIHPSDTAKDFAMLLKMIYLPGFPERNKVPDFSTFSSLLRITTRHEMPTVRSQVLEVVRDAYPETFEGLSPSKPLGEKVFSGRTPHPNEVLDLFVQQGLTSALPMAYYMATRRGPNSLMDGSLPRNATLSPAVLRPAIKGLMTLRQAELDETHRLIFEQKGSHPCAAVDCLSRSPAGTAALEAYRKVFEHIVDPSQLGVKVLEVPEFYEYCGGDLRCIGPGICSKCVERWETGHAELRKKVWAMLPEVFGLS